MCNLKVCWEKKIKLSPLNHYSVVWIHIAGSSPASPLLKSPSLSQQDWFWFTVLILIHCIPSLYWYWGLSPPRWMTLELALALLNLMTFPLIRFLSTSTSLWMAACPSDLSTMPLSMVQKSLCFHKSNLFLKVSASRHKPGIIEQSLVFPKSDFEMIGF